ncbi:MAG: phenylalanine--tRNA ligase subunit beta [Methylococcales bacterium]
MQISEAWLRTYVNPPLSTQELVAQLTMAGLEVDAVTPAAADFSGVVVGEVLSMQQHPDADRLRVCQVNVGDNEPLQIVCGASNVRVGLKIPAALVGAVLPGDFKIKKSKLRGEDSFGMLCSEKELGLASSAEGLMELAADAPIGTDIRDYLALNDNIIEVDLTPNRADCLSVEGIAREVAVLNQLNFATPALVTINEQHQDTLTVSVTDKTACPRYLGRLIKGINPRATTPIWLKERLRRAGIRSLGPVIDVTNYVLIELGQPLHAFDAAKLHGNISVRWAKMGEKLTLLNDQTITLDTESLCIADENQILALAGVMGGSASAVSEQTQDIFLECAFFTPLSIAGKARKFGLHTDSSHRFERGVDPFLQERAIQRATQLIVEIAGGNVGAISAVTDPSTLPDRSAVKLRRQQITKILGITPADSEVIAIFQRLGMQVFSDAEGWQITPPGCRFDIAIEADLLEELARIIGYNNLPMRSLLMHSSLGYAPEAKLTLDRVKDLLVVRGYQEAITYSFVDEDIQKLIDPEQIFVRLQNPISSELSIMRTTLWCGLLRAALYNTNRQQSRVRLFETGLRFIKPHGELLQQKSVAGLALGSVTTEQWGEATRKVDFYDVKADIAALFDLTACGVKYQPGQHSALHPGQTAQILSSTDEAIGWVGMLHPTLEKQLGFDSPVFLFELDQDILLNRKIPVFTTLSKFPSVRRDMALIVDDAVTANSLVACINNCAEPTLQEVCVFDIYRGKGVAKGNKSVALSLILQNSSQTLTESEIDVIFNRLLETLNVKLSARLRD